MEKYQIRIECLDCNFLGTLSHSLDDDRYEVTACPACGSEDVESEDESEE